MRTFGFDALRIGLLLIICLAVLGACSSGGEVQGAPPIVVETVKIEPRPFARVIPAVGSLQSSQNTVMASEIAGKVSFLDIPEGQAVKAGHVLARLDDAEANAALAVAKAHYDNAHDRLERMKALRSKGVIAQQNLDDASAELRAAEGELAQARTRLEKTSIIAPFDGLLGLRQVSLGSFVAPGTPIVRLVRIQPLELVFTVPEKHVLELATGQPVRGSVGGCAGIVSGSVSAIEPQVDPATRTVAVQALVPNEEGRLRPGMSVSLDVQVEEIPDSVIIPQEAIIRQGELLQVVVVGAESKPEFREVKVSYWNAADAVVSKGLAAGETVVAKGHQKVRPGSTLVSKPTEPITNPMFEVGKDAAGSGCSL